ncbi:MAG: GntR family transcriptional regulator [Rhodobacteraceae bacterium]|nr:GntR family transcriptional regulator [Paracoccaceae bacterium]
MTENHALPLYVQTAERLIREINAGRLLDGERLPPERDMAQDLGISVGTLRKALADLTDKGMLDRVQGSGNYVRHSPDATSVYAFFRLELVDGGGLPTATILSVDRLEKPNDLPDFGASRYGFRIRRLRRLGGVPAAVEEIWLDGAAKDQLITEDLSESLYLYYRDQLGLWITRAEDSVGVGHVPDWAPEAFPAVPGSVCGYVERLSWAQTGDNIEYSRTWFDSDKVRHITRMK